jgi:hypothetical protein
MNRRDDGGLLNDFERITQGPHPYRRPNGAPPEAELSAADNPKIFLDATLVRKLRADLGHAALLQGEDARPRERINHLVNRLEMLDSVVRIVGGGRPRPDSISSAVQ